MSENKNIPEIIYIPNYSFAEYFAQKDVTCISENVNIRTDKKEVELSSIKHQEYILKSKYDELLKEKEELEKENQRLNKNLWIANKTIADLT